jgi:hypothetical protein
VTERVRVPAATVAGVKGLSLPSVPTLYWEMVSKFATYANGPEGATVMEKGRSPARTVAGTKGLSVPSVPMLYWEMSPEVPFAT